jgi:hypothetical protein
MSALQFFRWCARWHTVGTPLVVGLGVAALLWATGVWSPTVLADAGVSLGTKPAHAVHPRRAVSKAAVPHKAKTATKISTKPNPNIKPVAQLPHDAIQPEPKPPEKISVYIFSYDFPTSWYFKNTKTTEASTDFYGLLQQSIATTPLLTLVPLAADADYQVNLRCGGVIDCDKVAVDVYDRKGQLTNTFKIRTRKWPVILGHKQLASVANVLVDTLDRQLTPVQLSNNPTLRYK